MTKNVERPEVEIGNLSQRSSEIADILDTTIAIFFNGLVENGVQVRSPVLFLFEQCGGGTPPVAGCLTAARRRWDCLEEYEDFMHDCEFTGCLVTPGFGSAAYCGADLTGDGMCTLPTTMDMISTWRPNRPQHKDHASCPRPTSQSSALQLPGKRGALRLVDHQSCEGSKRLTCCCMWAEPFHSETKITMVTKTQSSEVFLQHLPPCSRYLIMCSGSL